MVLFKKIQFELDKGQKQKITDHLQYLLGVNHSYKNPNKKALEQLASEPANQQIDIIIKACMAHFVLYLLNHANKTIDPHIPTHGRKVKAAFDALFYLSNKAITAKSAQAKEQELYDIIYTMHQLNQKIEERKTDKSIKLDDLDYNSVRTSRPLSSLSTAALLEETDLSKELKNFGKTINNCISLVSGYIKAKQSLAPQGPKLCE